MKNGERKAHTLTRSQTHTRVRTRTHYDVLCTMAINSALNRNILKYAAETKQGKEGIHQKQFMLDWSKNNGLEF